MSRRQLAFLAGSGRHQEVARRLEARYGGVEPEYADALVVLGGDGFMLHTLHEQVHRGQPLFGMRLGDVGFLMNRFDEAGLDERINQAREIVLNPLHMKATDRDGRVHEALAINEISLLRQTSQAAHVRVVVNERERVAKLVADGILVATAAGSTAYNLSAHGPILPLGTEALALTPICPFRPRRWRGAVLPSGAQIRLEILGDGHRPVSATADYDEFRDVKSVEVALDRNVRHRLLFDPEHSLEDRILDEQFL